jgi:hypothetical protein
MSMNEILTLTGVGAALLFVWVMMFRVSARGGG